MFVRIKKAKGHSYLQVVENRWEKGKVKQKVLHSLGRLDRLVESGELDNLIVSAQRFSRQLLVLGAHERGESVTVSVRRIGPGAVFGRLWSGLGIEGALKGLLAGRKFEFAVERAVFLTVLHRLLAPGSDRAAERWKEDYAIAGAEGLALHHLYRAMSWLGEALPAAGQEGSPAPRCVKDLVEEELFAGRRDLFSSLEMVFFDTTSIYFEGEGGSLGEYGYARDRRPDRRQLVVGVVLDGAGRPICCELWPGNTADAKALVPVVERMKRRFGVEGVCVVADRGMLSKRAVGELEALGWDYILGVRMRTAKEVREEVLCEGVPFEEVRPAGGGASPLKVKELEVEDRRYVLCLNKAQARRDRRDREAIVAALRDRISAGDESLIGNRGYRRFVKAAGRRFSIDEEKVEAEARYDGRWVLRTSTALPAAEVALKYKQLWMVEDAFRSLKSLLRTRPVYHSSEAAIRGHIFCSFLALVLRKELQDRLAARGRRFEWSDVVRDLDNLVETEISVGGKGYLLRSETKGTLGAVAQACGVVLPPVLRPLQR